MAHCDRWVAWLEWQLWKIACFVKGYQQKSMVVNDKKMHLVLSLGFNKTNSNHRLASGNPNINSLQTPINLNIVRNNSKTFKNLNKSENSRALKILLNSLSHVAFQLSPIIFNQCSVFEFQTVLWPCDCWYFLPKYIKILRPTGEYPLVGTRESYFLASLV